MRCIICESKKTFIVNSRKSKEGTNVWRRRKCKGCNLIFTTTEHTYNNNVMILKRNKKKVRMIYEKLFVSIFICFENTEYFNSGDAALKCKKITEEITKKIYKLKKNIITTQDIIFIVYKEISKIDKFAADKYKNYSHLRHKVLTAGGY